MCPRSLGHFYPNESGTNFFCYASVLFSLHQVGDPGLPSGPPFRRAPHCFPRLRCYLNVSPAAISPQDSSQ